MKPSSEFRIRGLSICSVTATLEGIISHSGSATHSHKSALTVASYPSETTNRIALRSNCRLIVSFCDTGIAQRNPAATGTGSKGNLQRSQGTCKMCRSCVPGKIANTRMNTGALPSR